MAEPRSPIRTTDDEARTQARRLIDEARFGSLATLDPKSGAPVASRVILAPTPGGQILTLVSDLSAHTGAMRANPAVSLLVGEPGPRGDPLVHPRLTIQARAEFILRTATEFDGLREEFLALHPKSRIYADFADFHFVRFRPQSAALNGGFGKAWHLTADDLQP